MVMFSNLRRFDVVDRRQRHAKLVDLGVALLEDDYPSVKHLLFLNANRKSMLSWKTVQSIDWQARQIKVADLDAGQMAKPELLKQDVLLHHDILDAQIIDLQNRRVTRANDLWLEEDNGRLLLRAADTSIRAILRRLSSGLYGQVAISLLLDWKYVEFLRGDPQAVKAGASYHLRITRLPPGEIARLADPLPYLHAAELLTLLPDPIAADTLEVMLPERPSCFSPSDYLGHRF